MHRSPLACFLRLCPHDQNAMSLIYKCLLALMLAAYMPVAWAQSGKVSGVVKDPRQAVVSGAKVTLSGASLTEARIATTDHSGEYSFTGLTAGAYSLEVNSPGFKQVLINGVKVGSAGETLQNIDLTLQGSSYSVKVNALALDTDVKTQPQAALLDIPEGVASDNIEFTAKDIEAMHPATLLDVMQKVPGLAVSYQGRQHMDFGSMRGGNFQVILDGVYMSQMDRLLAMLPVQLVESMTIVRDSTALSIGSLVGYHTMGSSGNGVSNQGFIIIRTKRASGHDGGFVSSGGNYGTALGHVYLGSKTGNWDYRGAYTYYNTEGKDTWNMQARNGSAMFHGGYASSGLTMDFLYYGSRGMRNMEYGVVLSSSDFGKCSPKATKVGSLCPTAMNMFKVDGDLFAINVARHWNDSNRTVLQYGFDRMTINAGMAASGSSTNEQDSTQGVFLLKHTYRLKGNSITGGMQWMKYIAPQGTAPTSGVVADRLDDLMAGWFVQDEYHLLGNRLVLDGGIRGDRLHNAWSITSKKKVDYWTPTFKTLAFGASYKFTPKFITSARYGYVNSLPPTNYVTMINGTLTSDLPTQTQNRGELSGNYAMNSHFKPNVSLYAYNTSNTTASATTCTGHTGSSSWLDANGNEIDCVSITTVLTAGTEVGFSGQIFGPFSYNTGYGYIGTDNKTVNKTLSHHFVNASLNYHQKNWFGNISMVYVGPLWSSASPGGTYYGELSNYSRVDGNAGYNFRFYGKPMAVTVFERNMNDNNYATRYVTGAYRDPGRQYGVELAAKFF